MLLDIIVLRLLHIISGAFWVGTILFMVMFLRPRLREFSSGVDRRLTGSVERVVGTATGVSGLITVVAGIALALRLRWGHLDTFFNTGWGYAILVGFIAAMAAFVAGGLSGGTSARLASITDGFADAPPGDDELAQVQELDARLVRLERIHALFIVIAVASMASARFV